MMIYLGILLTILCALLIGALFYSIFKSTGPWGTFWSFLLILILAGLAAEAWIAPIGPVAWGVAWLPVLFVIIIFALIMAAASPPRHREKEKNTSPEPSGEETAAVAIGGFFWVLLFLLLIIVLWGQLD
jgi:hypothetical protein